MPLFYYVTEDFYSRKKKFEAELRKLELEHVDFFMEVNNQHKNIYISLIEYIVLGVSNGMVFFEFNKNYFDAIPENVREDCVNLFIEIFEHPRMV
ncbi:hypothetical protein BDD43_4093 [Mucilaginibacter gracilis]|uniref:Uncharacterized protein n=1 Tax=Mucilaginibacter gracilis TaxID=423350 RepID=A0A495J632_9SPHI|nr:hypothetical protein BDD43_4093 [Mucilaginibacter gracilis]